MRMRVATAWARASVTGALVLGFIVIASPGGSAQGDPPLYVSATPAGSQDCSSWANACSLSEALTVRTSANDQIEMKAGVYSSAGNDAINANGDLGLNDDGVVIIGGYSGATEVTAAGDIVAVLAGEAELALARSATDLTQPGDGEELPRVGER